MLRTLLALLFLVLDGCSAAAPQCVPLGGNNPPTGANVCPASERCVFVGTASSPACFLDCADDAGACGTGQSCGCGASCQGCKDCQKICQ